MTKLKLPQRSTSTGGGTATADRESKIEGEGSYSAADRYNREVKEFVENSDVEAAAREAEPASAEEAADLTRAEEKGKSRARDDETATPRRRGRFLRRRR